MDTSITPCRSVVSDRFPVASFVVHVPPERVFEIACVTDPALLAPSQRHRRTPSNFFTTRADGLLRAPAGQATYLLPQDQLLRFAGSRKIYYALGTYGGVRGEDPQLSVPAHALEHAPCIALSPDFTGRGLDRRRIGVEDAARYGGSRTSSAALVWGGDQVDGGTTSETNEPARGDFAPSLVADSEPLGLAEPEEGIAIAQEDEPPGYEDAPDVHRGSQPPARGAALSSFRAQDDEGHDSAIDLAASLSSFSAQLDAGEGEAVDAPFEDDPRLGDEHPVEVPRYGRGAPTYGDGEDVELLALRDESLEEGEEETPARLLEDAAPASPIAGRAQGIPLTIPEKFRIVRAVAAGVTGDALYAARRIDDRRGVVLGFLEFSQSSGLLGRVLAATERRDTAGFRRIFGDGTADLLAVTRAPSEHLRMQPVGGRALTDAEWQRRFAELATLPAFQIAQNEVAIEGRLDPNLGFAAALGFDTDRALAMLVDRCVELGNRGGRAFVARSTSVLRSRRDVDDALSFLGFTSIGDLQRHLGREPHHPFDASAYAALVSALRGAGRSSPIEIPALPVLLDRLVAAAATRPGGDRARALRGSSALNDTVYALSLRALR